MLHEQRPGDDTLSVRPQNAHGVDVPRSRLPDGGMPALSALRIVEDELLLDGVARLNLATFVTTWMEPEAERLMAATHEKNIVDKDEYPVTAELENRCVDILAHLWHAPEDEPATGTSTLGSSEACMLAGLAFKRRWQHRGGTGTPNLVMGGNVQVCWEKFCRYWDVEPRMAPLTRSHPPRTHLTAESARPLVDENTIGVVAILGSTMDGVYEPVAEIAAMLDDLAANGGPDVPLHVDAASGGFIAPFLDPDLEWDFRLPRVQSINASGHKYGLVYPGVGWAVWRSKAALPDDLVFHVNYLGGDLPTFGLNFSRPGSEVVTQYYEFLRLGFDGYRDVQQASRDEAVFLAQEVAKMDAFELISDGTGIPVFAFKLRDEVTDFTVYDVSAKLRQHGWLVPAYTFPKDLDDMAALRIVVRNGFGHELSQQFVTHLREAVEALARSGGSEPPAQAFHH